MRRQMRIYFHFFHISTKQRMIRMNWSISAFARWELQWVAGDLNICRARRNSVVHSTWNDKRKKNRFYFLCRMLKCWLIDLEGWWWLWWCGVEVEPRLWFRLLASRWKKKKFNIWEFLWFFSSWSECHMNCASRWIGRRNANKSADVSGICIPCETHG